MSFAPSPASADDIKSIRRARLAAVNLWRVITETGIAVRSHPQLSARTDVDLHKGALVVVIEEFQAEDGNGWLRIDGAFGDTQLGRAFLPTAIDDQQMMKRTLAPEGATLWRVKYKEVNVRSKPSTRSASRGMRARGSLVEIAEEMPINDKGGRWLRLVPETFKPDGVSHIENPVGERYMYTWDNEVGPLLERYLG